ncbi:MFS transporter [Acinetobacter larvae]|nr:hypothetical protein [Acinetobacter larvae]
MKKIILEKDIIRLYISLMFFYCSDIALLMLVLWLSYQSTSSALFLGMMLSLSAICPFILKKIFWKLDILNLSLNQLMQLRVYIYIAVIMVGLWMGEHKISFFILAILLGLLSITLLSNYERMNTQLVLWQKVSSNHAARIMQTVIQIGSFSGALIGGILLKVLDFKIIVLLIALLDIFISCICLFLFKDKFKIFGGDIKKEFGNLSSNINLRLFYGLCINIGFIALHISVFILTTPIIFQNINHWSAAAFGVASGFVGIGAFLSVFFKVHYKDGILFLLALLSFDILFVVNKSIYLMPIFCLGIGFCVSVLRIQVKEKLIDLANNHADAERIGKTSTLVYILFQSLGSLLFGILLSYIDNLEQWILPSIAILILISLLIKVKHD